MRPQALRPQLKRDPLAAACYAEVRLTDRTNLWRTLDYYDPVKVLRELRVAERSLLQTSDRMGISLDPLSLRLRTGPLKPHREWRDVALFAYGMGLSKGITIAFAPHEAEDYDAVTCWSVDGQAYYCPLQLKELPPADLTLRVTLTGIIASLDRYSGPTETVLAIKLSQRPEIPLVDLRLPEIPFAEAYVFWANAPNSESFIVYGDLKQDPTAFQFPYPTEDPGAAA